MAKLVVFVLAIVFTPRTVNSVAPTGCTLDSSDSSTGIYTCVAGSFSSPLAFTAFTDPYPQRLRITAVTGTVGSGTFSGFSSFATNLLDLDYTASLEIVCSSGGTLTLAAATFTDMGYLQELVIRNCDVQTLPASVFANLGTLDSLRIEGGSVATLAATVLTGLTIQRLDVPIPKGEVVIKNSAVTGGIPTGFFDGLTAAKSITLDNIGLTTVDSALFSLTTAITSLSLANSGITTIDAALLSTLDGLSSLDLGGVLFDCTCDNLWILTYANTHSIALPSGIICNTPTEYQNKKAEKYWKDVCDTTDACTGIPGIVLGTSICMTIIEIVSYGLVALTLIIATIALIIICYVRRKLVVAKENLKKKRNSSWARVQNALRKGGTTGQKPPMKSQAVDGWDA